MKAPRPGIYRQSLEIPSSGTIASLRIAHLTAVGARPGPVTAIVAGQHGREVAGTLSAVEAFAALDPDQLAGTVHVLPVMNPLAMQIRQQDFPTEATRYRKLTMDATSNMDRLWDGGSPLDPLLTAVTSHVWDHLLAGCDAILDLHCWSEYFCAMAWAGEPDHDLLLQTGFPYLSIRPLSSAQGLGTLREKAWDAEIPVVVAELPGQNTASRAALDLGQCTIRNFLIAAGHIAEMPRLPPAQIIIDTAAAESIIKLPRDGLWLPRCKVGDTIEKDDILGEVIDFQSFEPAWQARSETSGLLMFNGPPIWGEDHRESPMVYSGQTIAKVRKIARVQQNP